MNKEISELNYIIKRMDLIDIYKIFHATTMEYIFFQETFSKLNHILGHKANLKQTSKNKRNNFLHLFQA
jgi:hypothetical protein